MFITFVNRSSWSRIRIDFSRANFNGNWIRSSWRKTNRSVDCFTSSSRRVHRPQDTRTRHITRVENAFSVMARVTSFVSTRKCGSRLAEIHAAEHRTSTRTGDAPRQTRVHIRLAERETRPAASNVAILVRHSNGDGTDATVRCQTARTAVEDNVAAGRE